jgi:predicted NAD-dependent protein-ADP-ribosyltransferase YbiA (DUF1768 family)
MTVMDGEMPLTPLNVYSRSTENIGRLMSNFAHTPFVLDGVEYASIEGFYVALKFLDPTKRAKVSRRRACEAARDKAPNKTDANDTDGLSGGFARILPGAKQVC